MSRRGGVEGMPLGSGEGAPLDAQPLRPPEEGLQYPKGRN